MLECRYTGEKLLDERMEVLLEAAWRPAPEGQFPDLPQSPRSNGSASSGAPSAGPQRTAGYVAPHLRGSGAVQIVALQTLRCVPMHSNEVLPAARLSSLSEHCLPS